MTHIKKVSVAAASSDGGKFDPAGAVFLQIWAVVFAFILQGALGSKAR